MFAIRLMETSHKPMFKRIKEIASSSNHIANDIAKRQELVRSKAGSKFVTYARLNPSLDTHPIYRDNHSLPDNLRMTFTRFRTSCHRLRIEMARWNRPVPPPAERTCRCDSAAVQDEEHVFACALTAATRQQAGFTGGCRNLFEDTSMGNLIMLKNCLEILEP